MKHLSRTSWLLSGLVLLCGCGGGGRTSHPSSGPSQQGQNITGNWQFGTTSTAGMPPLTISGSVTQSQTSVTGEVHVDGSSCFDQQSPVAMTGTLTNGNISLTSTAVNGQVITLTGSITQKIGLPDSMVGSYAINGAYLALLLVCSACRRALSEVRVHLVDLELGLAQVVFGLLAQQFDPVSGPSSFRSAGWRGRRSGCPSR